MTHWWSHQFFSDLFQHFFVAECSWNGQWRIDYLLRFNCLSLFVDFLFKNLRVSFPRPRLVFGPRMVTFGDCCCFFRGLFMWPKGFPSGGGVYGWFMFGNHHSTSRHHLKPWKADSHDVQRKRGWFNVDPRNDKLALFWQGVGQNEQIQLKLMLLNTCSIEHHLEINHAIMVLT